MKRITLPCEPFDFDGLEAFFEQKARRGFAPHSLEGLHAVFEREPASPVLYRVDYCDSADLDNILQRYSALGWEYVLGGPEGRAVFRAAQGEKPPRMGCVPEEIAEKALNAQARDYRLSLNLCMLVFTIGLAAALIYFRDDSFATLLGILLCYLAFFIGWAISTIQIRKKKYLAAQSSKARTVLAVLTVLSLLAGLCAIVGRILLYWGYKIFPSQ